MLTKAQEARLKAYAKTPQVDHATMYTRGITTTAMFWFLPMLGWIEPMEVPSLFLSGALLKIGDQAYAGSASWRVPITPGNGDAPLVLLASLGWNGMLWPEGAGWPTGFKEEDGLHLLLQRAPIANTFSFPPDPEKGNRVLKVLVSKTGGSCLQPPDVAEDHRIEPNEAMRQKLAQLAADPSPFMPPGWQSGKRRQVAGIDFQVNP